MRDRTELGITLVLALLAAALPLACRPTAQQAAPASPDGIAGTYKLVSVGGNPVPKESGSITLNDNGTLSSVMDWGVMHFGDGGIHNFRGTYVKQDAGYVLTWEGAGQTRVTIDGSKLTMNNEGTLFVYEKEGQGAEPAAPGQSAARSPQEVLDQFIGTWDCDATLYEGPNASGRSIATRSTFARVLGGRFVQENGRDSENNASITLYTYDGSSQCYRSSFFSSSIGHPEPTTGRWNETARTLDWTTSGNGYTTTIQHRFFNENAWEATCEVMDPAGTKVFRGEYKVTRAKDPAPVVLSEAGNTGGPLPAEQKVLDPLVGTWRQETTMRKAKWFPEEKRTAGTYTFKRILGGRYVLETGEDSESSSLLLYTYDAQRGSYLIWNFNVNNQTPDVPVSARWNEAGRVLECFGFPEKDGQRTASQMHLVSNDTIISTYGVKDTAGETLCDIEFKMTRISGEQK